MLDRALVFFKEELSNYIKIKTGGQREDVVQFPEIQLPKEIVMQNNAITSLMVNLEEERTFRSGATRINHLSSQGNQAEIPHLDLNFHLMFVANFKDYAEGLRILSLVLKFFRSYRLFTQKKFPQISPEIQQLSTELVNLTFMEQSELWRSLEMPCSPSALYKVRMLIFQDAEIEQVETGTALRNILTETSLL
ncbi:Pvc16 family protein [Pleurocapsa sp. PCC 7319]|uniref:Pvc16 family protein n=1 Tax=Pleurocapsa sp. PCC 7319 TaxID=118161 RepID=UPI0003461ABC|nr:Pvc16 family protein [Pleurocapsa sp. PCC 7319]